MVHGISMIGFLVFPRSPCLSVPFFSLFGLNNLDICEPRNKCFGRHKKNGSYVWGSALKLTDQQPSKTGSLGEDDLLLQIGPVIRTKYRQNSYQKKISWFRVKFHFYYWNPLPAKTISESIGYMEQARTGSHFWPCTLLLLLVDSGTWWMLDKC